MKLIESTILSKMCDYTFGDQAGIINNIHGGFMKDANIDNKEFIKKYESIKSFGRNYMTLFIDNIRLYKREIASAKESDKSWIEKLFEKNDLLKLCASLPDMNFIIFTGYEDTPIDKYIYEAIPDNVLRIVAVNSTFFSHKVYPLPYGLQRKMRENDNRLSTMEGMINDNSQATKLLYVNHAIHTNVLERSGVKELFVDKQWASVENKGIEYGSFLKRIKEHKFVICPIGNAIDCHRNWEVLYMKRVPVMKKNEYLEFLFKDFPVLFVEDFSSITEELLIKHDYLYEEALLINDKKLDLDVIFKQHISEALNITNIKRHLKEKQIEYTQWLKDNNQGMVEFKILPYLQDIESGVFVEAGALNGLFQSNTKILEDLGWTGLLIEPSFKAYEKCLINRKSPVENCALVSFDFKEDYAYGSFIFDGKDGAGAMSAIRPNGAVRVKAETLTNLLLKRNMTYIDFFSLDVEGYEVEVLKGIDFSKITINYILLETNSNFYSLESLNDFLYFKGFKKIKNVSNFTRENLPGWEGYHQDYLYKNIRL